MTQKRSLAHLGHLVVGLLSGSLLLALFIFVFWLTTLRQRHKLHRKQQAAWQDIVEAAEMYSTSLGCPMALLSAIDFFDLECLVPLELSAKRESSECWIPSLKWTSSRRGASSFSCPIMVYLGIRGSDWDALQDHVRRGSRDHRGCELSLGQGLSVGGLLLGSTGAVSGENCLDFLIF